VEITSTPRRFPVFSPFGRTVVLLFAAAFVAFQLGKNEVNPVILLVVATVVALVVAILLVPRGSAFIRKPRQDPDEIVLRKIKAEPAIVKRSYSTPHLTKFESREVSEPSWGSLRDDDSFQLLRPFYVVYPKRDFTVIAASLKFPGDKDYRGWQPVADSAPQQSDVELPDKQYQWTLMGYVPPGASFDAKLKLRDSQSRLGITVLHNLVGTEDRPFQSVHLKISAAVEQFTTTASA
jgi:phosphate/sulfate permease